MIEIDGTMGEGGGQVLRSALTLSLVTGQPVRLHRIRARRARLGLRFQHLMAVQAAVRVSGGRVAGDRVGSQELQFEPGAVTRGDYHFDIGTAGATALVLQTVLLPLALASGPSRIAVTGGTHVPFSPCFHYLDWHWRVLMARMGLDFALEMPRAGFFPPGGGELRATIPGAAKVAGLYLPERGRLLGVRGLSAVANLPTEIAERQRGRALKLLSGLDCPVEIGIEVLPAASPGTVLCLLAAFEQGQACFFALGARGKRAELVAEEAASELLGFLATDGAVDRWLADQLLLPLACAGEPSVLRTAEVTLHLLTQAEVIRHFLPARITIDGAPGGPGAVRVDP
jgi:RNA 3'-terminal phosphate cyclase (ATP)